MTTIVVDESLLSLVESVTYVVESSSVDVLSVSVPDIVVGPTEVLVTVPPLPIWQPGVAGSMSVWLPAATQPLPPKEHASQTSPSAHDTLPDAQ